MQNNYIKIYQFIDIFLDLSPELHPGYWHTKPKDIWYKLPKYITVNDPFMKVTISEELKGSEITLEDILIATNALAVDQYRTMNHGNGYRIIGEHDDTLILEPDIDNFSS